MDMNLIGCIKGLSILIVIFYHMGVISSPHIAITAFFIVAGYLAMKSNDKRFLRRKIIRLYPMLIIICALTLVSLYLVPSFKIYREQNIMEILYALTGTMNWHLWIGPDYLMHLGYLWFTSMLMQFYLIFVIIKRGLKRVMVDSYTVVDLLFVMFFIRIFCFIATDSWSSWNTFVRLPEFLFGCLLARWDMNQPVNKAFNPICLLGRWSYEIYIIHWPLLACVKFIKAI